MHSDADDVFAARQIAEADAVGGVKRLVGHDLGVVKILHIEDVILAVFVGKYQVEVIDVVGLGKALVAPVELAGEFVVVAVDVHLVDKYQ